MNGAATLGDVMSREFVGVSESDSLEGVAALLAGEGVDSAVVLRGGEPVGTVRALDLLGHLAAGNDLDGTPVEAVMATAPPTLGPEASVGDAVALLSEATGWQVVVTDGTGVLGTVDARDVMAADATLPRDAGVDAEVSVVAATAHDAEGSAVDTAEARASSAQGICELCGSMSRQLTAFNGQQLCADCLDR